MNYLTEILNCSHNQINTKLEYGIYKEQEDGKFIINSTLL
jgi:hypothetical protein